MAENSKIQVGSINQANVTFNNNNDAARVFNISTNANIANGNVIQSCDNGSVVRKEDGVQIANFYSNSTMEMTVTFYNNPDLATQTSIISAIDSFKTELKSFVLSNPSIISL